MICKNTDLLRTWWQSKEMAQRTCGILHVARLESNQIRSLPEFQDKTMPWLGRLSFDLPLE
jgi:uncharacterized protein YaeQ